MHVESAVSSLTFEWVGEEGARNKQALWAKTASDGRLLHILHERQRSQKSTGRRTRTRTGKEDKHRDGVGMKEGRKERDPACGCVSRSIVCTGCESVQATVSCPVCFCAWGAAVCHGASEGARLPAPRIDTRSRLATHNSSILTVNP